MISRFVNRFKKTDLDEQRAFQKRVRAVLLERYPNREFILAEDPLTLKMDETILGLTNLRSNFLLTTQTDAELKELVADQFDIVLPSSEHVDRLDLTWSQARLKLMPQLMPEEYLTTMDLVHLPFGDEVVIGFVIDSEDAYSYVRETTISEWGIDTTEVRSTAISNLNESSKGIETSVFPGDNGIFAVNTLDGFDAVRIIVPDLQQLIGEHIGTPFYVGVPNRDFLICWSKNDDKEFQSEMASQVNSDFAERPYPLSGRTFVVNSNGSISLAEISDADPRSLTAETN